MWDGRPRPSDCRKRRANVQTAGAAQEAAHPRAGTLAPQCGTGVLARQIAENGVRMSRLQEPPKRRLIRGRGRPRHNVGRASSPVRLPKTACECPNCRSRPRGSPGGETGARRLFKSYLARNERRRLGFRVTLAGWSVSSQLRQKTENLDIQPDECHGQSECCIPLHPLRRTIGNAVFDEVEIENKIECRDTDDHQAKGNTDRTVFMDKRNRSMNKKLEHHADQIDNGNAEGCSDYYRFESLRRADNTRLICSQKRKHDTEGQKHCLKH